jgi:integrase
MESTDMSPGAAATARGVAQGERSSMSTNKGKRSPARTGIEERHRKACRSHERGSCGCTPSYRAKVYDKRASKWHRSAWFPTLAAARAWRIDAMAKVQAGTIAPPDTATFREVATAWLDAAHSGRVRNRSGKRYKPGVIIDYGGTLDRRVLPTFGGAKFARVQRGHLQRWVGDLQAAGLAGSTIRNALMPLRVLYRDAESLGFVGGPRPLAGLRLPASDGRRDRFESTEEAAGLIDALSTRDRARWATAFYAGLRRGEIAALRWQDVDLAAGLVRAERSSDYESPTYVDPKSYAGRRVVPLVPALRDALAEHRLDALDGHALVFGSATDSPLDPQTVTNRARKAWAVAGLSPITLHECRHTFASSHRGRGQRKGRLNLHGPRLHPDHLRPLRPI